MAEQAQDSTEIEFERFVDRRDLRDPEALGCALNKAWQDAPVVLPLSQVYDAMFPQMAFSLVPDTRVDYSATEITVPLYIARMQKLAAMGDLSACVVLVQKGWPLSHDIDPHLIERARRSEASSPEPVDA